MWQLYAAERLRPYKNVEVFIRRLNQWSPLLRGYPYAARALFNIYTVIDEEAICLLNYHWNTVFLKISNSSTGQEGRAEEAKRPRIS